MDTELQISFFDCCEIPQTPVLTVYTTEDNTYTYVEFIARKFSRWITVTASQFCREIIRTILRIFCDFPDCAAFNRNTFIREGGLRL